MMASPGIPEVEMGKVSWLPQRNQDTGIKYTTRTSLRQGIDLLEVCEITQSQQSGTNFGRTDFFFVLPKFDQIITLCNCFNR